MTNIAPDPRYFLLKQEVQRLIPKLEGVRDVDLAISILQHHRDKLTKVTAVAVESQARVFLNQRWTVFGSQFEGPWPIEFVTPLEVTYKRAGLDFTTHRPFETKWTAELTHARFVKLGRLNYARYVELQVAAAAVIKTQREREEYGIKATDQLLVHATMYQMIQCKPQWLLDRLSKIRIARLRAIAANAGVIS